MTNHPTFTLPVSEFQVLWSDVLVSSLRLKTFVHFQWVHQWERGKKLGVMKIIYLIPEDGIIKEMDKTRQNPKTVHTATKCIHSNGNTFFLKHSTNKSCYVQELSDAQLTKCFIGNRAVCQISFFSFPFTIQKKTPLVSITPRWDKELFKTSCRAPRNKLKSLTWRFNLSIHVTHQSKIMILW